MGSFFKTFEKVVFVFYFQKNFNKHIVSNTCKDSMSFINPLIWHSCTYENSRLFSENKSFSSQNDILYNKMLKEASLHIIEWKFVNHTNLLFL
jgi:hypothetical protein